ncbi:hypothetical protein FHU33_2447 [Blastococcus colisei]|uniref:Uncharacterized protein n=1 Tax=Blastococcus colisei TaxID=1564162 RepID=A0A543PG17_9ACTN|nr:hypothetical protein [Blastococcus colisei]TQN43027.1 hypothetical protein FHU33_2447 [Blastococcus colisei]
MRIRRPIAALFTALALFGGGATMTGCEAAGEGQNDGTTDEEVDELEPEEADRENLPDTSDPDQEQDDLDDDTMDPD